jgi:hypothetical protein
MTQSGLGHPAVDRASRLYEQDREEPLSPSWLGQYVRRWVGWARQVDDPRTRGWASVVQEERGLSFASTQPDLVP